jgi:predicted flap endonuclease-1-like 5' DNA nuclease
MKILSIEGIGPVNAEKLSAIGVKTVEALLEKGATPKGRESLAEATGVSEKLILEWVNLADLIRIKGIGEEYSDLLEEAGVDTVKELKHRNPDNLYKALIEINQQKKLVRRAPTLKEVQKWIAEAAELPAVVTY